MKQIPPRKAQDSIFALALLILTLLIAGCRPLPASSTSSAPVVLTPIVAATLTSSPSVTTTPVPVIVPDTPTPFPADDELIKTITTTIQPRLYDTYPSPDGAWRAEVLIYECAQVGGPDENAYEQLKLINVGDGTEHIIDSQFLNCGGLGAAGLAGLFWSSNSRYFYYTDGREGVPDGCGYWERPILRLEMQTLHAEDLGGASRSPDETKFVTWHEDQLVLWDNDQGEIARFAAVVPNVQIGPITWSPDGQSLIYMQLEMSCPTSGDSYVIHVDLSTGEQKLLLESEEPTFGHAVWELPDQITLFEFSGAEWKYNLITEELERVP
jgi:hypothetical protein